MISKVYFIAHIKRYKFCNIIILIIRFFITFTSWYVYANRFNFIILNKNVQDLFPKR